MLTPEYLSWITDRAEEVASSLFSRILNKIIERIFARFKRQDDYVLTSVDKHNIDTLQEAGYLLDDIQKEIVEATGIEAKVIKEAFEDAGIEGMEIDDEVYEQVGIDVPDLTESPAAVRAMQRNYEATMGEWKNLTRTTVVEAEKRFIEACDEAFENVNSGFMGLDQAIKEAIDKLISEGVTSAHYPSGKSDTIDVAVARAVRTGIAQAAAQVTLTRMKEMGVDLLITSAHLGARPSHEAWQGQIFHVDWSTIDIYRRYAKDDPVPIPNTASKYPDFVQSTRFGYVDGLCGANCRHSFSPYFEGMPNPYDGFNNKKSREIYELEKKQRALERAIRKTKRAKAAYKIATDNAPAELEDIYREEYKKKSDLLRKQNKAYYEFCEKNKLRTQAQRLEVPISKRKEIVLANKDNPEETSIAFPEKMGMVKTENAMVYKIGKIYKKMYEKVAPDIATDEIVITTERMEHIEFEPDHPGSFTTYGQHLREAVTFPDYILKDRGKGKSTAVVLKEINDDIHLRVIVRLATGEKNKFKNSIITMLNVSKKTYEKYINNGTILYNYKE